MRVLVWNLFHGRAAPPAGRPLLYEFAETLAGWEWDVALLQEVPPWWPPLLAARCRAEVRTAPTSRNQLPALRRAVASRAPDRLKSNGGGANAILVRAPWTITAHGRRRLRIRPERRVVHAVRVERSARAGRPSPHDRAPIRSGGVRPDVPTRSAGAGPDEATGGTGGREIDGAWIGNVHSQLGHWDDAAGMAAPLADLGRAATQLETWGRTTRRDAPDRNAGPQPGASSATPPALTVGPVADPPIILGGDLNLPRDTVATSLSPGWTRIASSGPDHVVGRGAAAVGPSQRLDHGTLSDHAPLLVEIAAE